jgi:hypothetical protein
VGTDDAAWKSEILAFRAMLVLDGRKKLSILLLIVSSILSLEANFLDRLSIILLGFGLSPLKVRNCWKNYYLDNYLNSYLGS